MYDLKNNTGNSTSTASSALTILQGSGSKSSGASVSSSTLLSIAQLSSQ
jgi:hypothetical protein